MVKLRVGTDVGMDTLRLGAEVARETLRLGAEVGMDTLRLGTETVLKVRIVESPIREDRVAKTGSMVKVGGKVAVRARVW